MSPERSPEKTVVSVDIAGEEYKLRALATPDYTRDCAEHLDRMIREIRRQSPALELQRAAILAGLALTDQLFQARKDAGAALSDEGELVLRLAMEIEEKLSQSNLAATS